MKSIFDKTWKFKSVPDRLIQKKQQKYNISYLLSKIFTEYNYSEEEIHNSLTKYKRQYINYYDEDFKKAGDIFFDCLNKNKKILIFGDYDVDGYSSSYLLYDFITNLNLRCDYYIPDRFVDGYGPNIKILKKLVEKKKYDLIFFLDCGTNSSDEINFLEQKGLKTIIIDHHNVFKIKNYSNTIIINPKKKLKSKKFNSFCATVLVFFFIKYFNLNYVKKKINNRKYLFFSAIATICDQMPLRDLNRDIVREGLNIFDTNIFFNLKKIFNPKRKISSSDIGYILGPILNSSSRLGYPDLVMKLLIENNKETINKISEKLLNLNQRRKNLQFETFTKINKNIKIHKNKVIFKFEKNINEGLLGVIAANFVDKYNKPSLIFTTSNGFIKCSARSVHDFDIGKIFNLAYENKIILKGGGHSMAAGCILNKDKIKVFENFLNDNYLKKFKSSPNVKYFTSEQNIDSLKIFAKKELQLIEPFGNNNINPIFLIKKNKIVKYKVINQRHLHLMIKNKFNKFCMCFVFDAVDTKLGHILTNSKKEIDLLVQINNKIINKNTDFNLIIKDAIT